MLYEKEEKKLRKRINRLIRTNKINKDEKIIVWGACENSKILIKMLREKGFFINKIVDNDSKKIGTFCSGVKVEMPLGLNKTDYCKILIFSYYQNEIAGQLDKYGFKNHKDYYLLASKMTWQRLCICQTARILWGLKAFKNIKKKYGNNAHIFVCPYTGTGDVYIAGLMLRQFLIREKINNYVLVVISAACKKVAQLFNIKNIEQISKEAADRMVKLNAFAPDKYRLTVCNDSWASLYTNPTEWIRGLNGLNFTQMFKYAVFEENDNVALNIPIIFDTYINAKDFLAKNNLPIGKTVILAPYSNTLSELPNKLWEDITEKLIQGGYKVCTNSCGEQEPPITGTTAIFFPLNIAIAVLNLAGTFIGVRSGFCDIISSSTAKKIIIYEKDSYFYQGTTYDYFSLNKIGLCDDAVELFYEEEIESLKEQILINF